MTVVETPPQKALVAVNPLGTGSYCTGSSIVKATELSLGTLIALREGSEQGFLILSKKDSYTVKLPWLAMIVTVYYW